MPGLVVRSGFPLTESMIVYPEMVPPFGAAAWKLTKALPGPVAVAVTFCGGSGRSRTLTMTRPCTTRSGSFVASMTR